MTQTPNPGGSPKLSPLTAGGWQQLAVPWIEPCLLQDGDGTGCFLYDTSTSHSYRGRKNSSCLQLRALEGQMSFFPHLMLLSSLSSTQCLASHPSVYHCMTFLPSEYHWSHAATLDGQFEKKPAALRPSVLSPHRPVGGYNSGQSERHTGRKEGATEREKGVCSSWVNWTTVWAPQCNQWENREENIRKALRKMLMSIMIFLSYSSCLAAEQLQSWEVAWALLLGDFTKGRTTPRQACGETMEAQAISLHWITRHSWL